MSQRRAPRSGKQPAKVAAPSKQPQKVVRQEEDDDIDMGDLIVGLVALVGLPVVTLIILSFLGMPFGGTTEMNSQQADVYRGLDKHVPQMTDQEAVTILNRVKYWIDDRAKEYMKRSRATDDNSIKSYWQGVAKKVLGIAEADLKRVQNNLRKDPDASRQILDSAQQFLLQIDTLQVQIQQEDPFRQVR